MGVGPGLPRMENKVDRQSKKAVAQRMIQDQPQEHAVSQSS